MAIASLPERITGRNLLWRRMLIHLIESDPGYAGGRYDSQPAGLAHAMALFQLMVGSPRVMASDLRSVAAAVAIMSFSETERGFERVQSREVPLMTDAAGGFRRTCRTRSTTASAAPVVHTCSARSDG